MRSKLTVESHPLYDALVGLGVAKRRAVQLQNLVVHCEYNTWTIDSLSKADFILATVDIAPETLTEYASYAREQGATLCIMNPYYCAERWAACSAIIDAHPSTTVDNRAYLLVFNNHLPKQRFRI
jgi:hypothetical protein